MTPLPRPTLTALRRLTAAIGLATAFTAMAQSTAGEVRRIDKDQGRITLKHGEIANLDMPPMQMVFRVKDRQVLDTLAVGDKVRFDADKVNGEYTVTRIEKAR